MAAKRAGEPSSPTTAKKMPKLTNEEASNVNDASQIPTRDRDSYFWAEYLAEKVAKVVPSEAYSKLLNNLLHLCEQRGCEEAARQFLVKKILDLKIVERDELLWTAISNGRQDTAVDLVRSGVDLNNDNRAFLHEVLRSLYMPRKEELVRLMLDHGADVNARDSEGRSVLHLAIALDSAQVVEMLLDHGAQVTINENCKYLDDLFSACDNKLELLPKLIEHQVPDEETRNRRGIIAVNYLILINYSGSRLTAAMRMVEKILDLGVPVDGTNSVMERSRGMKVNAAPLQMALYCKNTKAIKLLLNRGANPNMTDSSGQTSLYQAMKLYKDSTHVGRWLIERGVSIHTRNRNGANPLHGACRCRSLKNLHLFINLGADLNVTDNYGQTPFRMLEVWDMLKCKDVPRLVIKHLALIVAKGGNMVDNDLALICMYEWSEIYFEECKEQLERMKREDIWTNVSYFSLFTRDMYSMIQLVKNKNFVERFKEDEKTRVDLFPEYSYMLLHCFELAEMRLKMLLAEKNKLHEAFERAMPDHVVENIAYYWSFEKLERCRQDYYISFHANLKNTKADKAKIL